MGLIIPIFHGNLRITNYRGKYRGILPPWYFYREDFVEQSVLVDVEGVGFRPRAVVAGRGVVAVCTRISSQEYVYDK